VHARTELDRLAAVRPEILERTEDVVDAAEQDRMLHQILTATASPLAHTRGPRHNLARRRTLLTSGLALGAAGVAAAVVLASGAPTAPAGHTATGHPHTGRHDAGRPSAWQVLLAAATAAAARPAGSGAYWYVTSIWVQPGYQETDETWSRRSGNPEWVWAGKKSGGRIIKIAVTTGYSLTGDPGILNQLENLPPLPVRRARKGLAGSARLGWVSFRQLQRLPTDPAALEALIAAVNRRYERALGLRDPGHEAVFLSLTDLVAALPTPPQVRAAAFRAMAALPDVTSLGPVDGGQGLRLALGGNRHATLVVNTATSQVRDILSVTGVGGETSSWSITARWVNRRPSHPPAR
jgi:hypothetical protein